MKKITCACPKLYEQCLKEVGMLTLALEKDNKDTNIEDLIEYAKVEVMKTLAAAIESIHKSEYGKIPHVKEVIKIKSKGD